MGARGEILGGAGSNGGVCEIEDDRGTHKNGMTCGVFFVRLEVCEKF